MQKNRAAQPCALQQIKASAGSGKTHTLITKLLEIFCVFPERISHSSTESEDIRKALLSVLAITFTNAAASDMKAKLITRLKTIALGLSKEDFSARQAEKTIEACIANYSALNIRTIDSFLLMLLKQNIFEYHLPPRFDILFSNEEFFSPLYDDLAFTALYKKKEHDEISKELLSYYEDIYSNFLQLTDHKGFLGLQKTRLSVLAICSILSQFPDETRQRLSDKKSIYHAFEKNQKKYEKALFSLEKFVLKHEIKLKKPLKDAFEEYKERNKISSLFTHSLETLKKECIYAKDLKALDEVEQAEKSRKLDALFLETCSSHKLAFLLKSSLKFQPFIMLARLTLEIQAFEEESKEKLLSQRVAVLLSEAIDKRALLPAMLDRMPYELDHLLVDEFQDTNREQWEIISKFVEEIRAKNGAFTYVGDVKQAIYSWRGGDSSLFEEVYQEAYKPKIKEFLDTNWRSSKNVIEFNNKVFAQFEDFEFTKALEETIMKEDCLNKTSFASDLNKIYEQVAQKVSPAQIKGDAAGKESIVEGRVCLYPFEAPGISNEVLHSALNFQFLQALRDACESYEYKDMAVLVRDNKECALFAQWLTDEDIPVITEGALLLSANFIIKQCISFIEFLKNENNSVALWHLLGFKGLFSLEHEEVLSYEDYFNAQSEGLSLYACLKNKNSDLSIKVFEILEELKVKSTAISLYSLICLLFEKTQIYTRFENEKGFFSRFLELVFQADKNNISSPTSFLSYWEEEGELEKIPMPEGIDAIRIMTIHKSKGAEFDVVFVWDNLKKKSRLDSLKLYETEGLTFIAPHSAYHPDYEQDNKIIAIEAMNLLYVALTRAKKELHVFYKQSTASTLLPMPFIFDEIQKECTKKENPSRFEYGSRKARKRKKMQIQYDTEQSRPLSSLKFKEAALNFGELKRVERTQEIAIEKGLVFHSFLEKYFKFAKYKEQDIQIYVEQALNESTLDASMKEEVKIDAIDLFNWIKSLPDFYLWKNNSLSEQNMLTKQGKILRADLCVFNEDYVHVIDFKTGTEYSDYKEQVLEYMKLISNIDKMKGKKIKGSIVYLDLKKIVEVIEEGKE